MCSLTRLYVWVNTAICVSWYSHMCRLIRIYSLKSDAYRVKKRLWQLVRAPRLRSLAFIAREPCREKEGISIKKIPFIALSWHPRFLFYPFELTLFPINIGWAEFSSDKALDTRLIGNKKPTNQRFVGFCPLTLLFCSVGSAERQGFEPREPLGSTVFKTAAIDHSAIFPICFAIKRFV